MPEYTWEAFTPAGRVEHGTLSALSSIAALKQLRDQGLTPLNIEETSGVAAGGARGNLSPLVSVSSRAPRQVGGTVNSGDVLNLTSSLAIMLRAGLPLDNALRVLIGMTHKPSVNGLMEGILEAVKGGAPLSRALGAHSGLFGDFYINMVRSGEVSGQMSSVMDRLVEHMERQRALRDSVISATIYPAILLTVAVLSVIAMLGFVVPQFEKLFTDMGEALPLPTRVVMQMGHVFTQYGIALGVAFACFVFLAVKWSSTLPGKRWWQARLLRVPLVGELALKYQLTLFSRSLGTLLGNGVPMLTALHIATQTTGNTTLRDALAKVAPIVKEGGKLVQAVSATGIFEPLAINLIRVGEETGRVGPMLLELSNILNREVENSIKRLLTLVEPVLILVLGALIAAIIVSILLGILSINDLAV